MSRRFQALYWQGILITLVMALAAIGVAAKLKIDDTRTHLTAMLQAASKWTLDSNDDLQSLADAISSTSPQIRVTFLLDSGLVLADSARDADPDADHYADREIAAARGGEVGRHLRISETSATLMLYVARRISPQLILRLSYPVFGIARALAVYGAGLLALFLVLFQLQRRGIARFVSDQRRQLDDIRRLLDGELEQVEAVFPEYQPSLDAIAYRVRRLKEDQREILRTMNLRSDFVANASHELRSPLTSVRGYAELLEEGMADTPEERELCLRTILGECDRMLAVIEDILRLSKAERDPKERAEPCAVAPVAEEVRRALQPRAAAGGIALSVEGEAELRVPEKDLWEVLYNLMDNAVRYGREGGSVKVALSEGTIAVEDDGIGIAPEHLPRVFEQFYRVDETRDAAPSGTGLGLSIVRAIAQRHGGCVRVESEAGKGSRFVVEFEEAGDETTASA